MGEIKATATGIMSGMEIKMQNPAEFNAVAEKAGVFWVEREKVGVPSNTYYTAWQGFIWSCRMEDKAV